MKKFGKTDYGNGVKYWSLFGRPIAKKIDNCFYLLKKQKDNEYTPDHWYVGWHSWMFDISYEECGYETGNAELNISIFGWHSVFKLPWKSKRFPDGDCDAPKWGIVIHNNTFWLYKGGDGNWGGGSKWWTWDLPFFTWEQVRHDVECDFGDSEIEKLCLVSYDALTKCTLQNPDKRVPKYGYDYLTEEEYEFQKDFECDYNNYSGTPNAYMALWENPFVKKYHYNYKDNYDGEIIPCVFWVEEREWRPKWLTWTNKFKRVKRYIEIEFDSEVGKDKGSWKGGCLGCGYDLKDDETPMECIKRMEREREF